MLKSFVQQLIALIGCMLIVIISPAVSAQTPVISYATPQTYTVGAAISTLSPSNSGTTPAINGQTILFAGTGYPQSTDGQGAGASFDQPFGMATDAQGNLYVADASGHVIRKVTPSGTVTTIAGTVGLSGSQDGIGSNARFNHPVGLVVDASGNIYVADEVNNKIRKITPSGVVTTVAGNGTAGLVNSATATSAEFNLPCGVALDASGNIYVADNNNNVIREISTSGVTTYAGTGTKGATNGTLTAATFNNPFSVVFDALGNLYVADRANQMIRKIAGTTVSTLAGVAGTSGFADGTGTAAKFSAPTEITSDGTNVFVADEANQRIRMVTPGGVVTTLSGTGTASSTTNGPGNVATFNGPFGIAADPRSGFLYVGDNSNFVKKVATNLYSVGQDLSAGLTFNSATGSITGTPTVALASTYYLVTAYGTTNSSAYINLTVLPPNPLNLSANQNYVAIYTPKDSLLTNLATLYSACSDPTQVQASVQYFDGLGRDLQAVEVKGSPAGKDIVQPVAYDTYGRQPYKYLPYAEASSNDGSYKTAALTNQLAFYNPPGSGASGTQQVNSSGIVVDPYPFVQTVFEPSPVDRVTEQGAPGASWQPTATPGNDHTMRASYLSNDQTTTFNSAYTPGTPNPGCKTVALYTVTIGSGLTRALTWDGSTTYGPGQLTETVTKDENWTTAMGCLGTTETYTDKFGHVVLKRTYNLNTANNTVQMLSTYYVYDELNNLCFVLPPMSMPDSAIPTTTLLSNFCYQYVYDDRNRLIQKKLPGNDWIYSVYNNYDKVVLTQDGNQRLTNQWTVTKYDAQGRTIVTALWNAGSVISQATLQSSIYAAAQWDTRDYTNNPSNATGYVISSYPAISTVTTAAVLTVTYYDDYAFTGEPAAFAPAAGTSSMTRGMPTATKTAVLNTINFSTAPDMLWTVNYYDDMGRVTKSYVQHYLGGSLSVNNYDVFTNTYDYTNELTGSTRLHYKNVSGSPSLAITVANTYTYDQVGRKKQTREQINSNPQVLLSDLEYNEAGQLLTKNLHSTNNGGSYLQNTAYAYNERGWLSKINDPSASWTTSKYFAEQLNYDHPVYGSAQFNGNVAEELYNSQDSPNLYTTYTYDNLNRLTAGNSSGTGANNVSENGISYDLNGNIQSLTRMVNGIAKTISYPTYTGNRLMAVSGSYIAGSYSYDANGNTVTDGEKGITNTTFNTLNLPKMINVSTGGNTGTVTYTYAADGRKLRKVSTLGTGSTEDYVNGIQYLNGALDFISTEEGRVLSLTNYEYTLTDHLGNNRVTFNSSTGKSGETDYYPFGLNNTKQNSGNLYLYNKKEIQSELTEYDYGARFYDPVVARWTTVDPLAELNRKYSTYSYVINNPVRNIDPDGMDHVSDILNAPDPSQVQREGIDRGLAASGNSTVDPKTGEVTPLDENGIATDPTQKAPKENSENDDKQQKQKGDKDPSEDGILHKVADGILASGISIDAANAFIEANAGAKIYYANINGVLHWVATSKVNTALEELSHETVIAGILVDGALYLSHQQSGRKTAMNLTVTAIALAVSGPAGILIVTGYLILDKAGFLKIRKAHYNINHEMAMPDALKYVNPHIKN